MTRRTRNAILIGVAAVLVLCVVSAVLVVRSTWLREWLRDQAAYRASAAIEGEVGIEAITGSLLRDVTLHGVSVRKGGVTIVEAESISANYDAWQLIRGNLGVDRLELIRPTIRLIRDEQGWNVARLIRADESAETAEPRAIVVRQIAIVGGAISAEDGETRLASISNVDASASLAIEPERLIVDLESLSARDEIAGVDIRAAARVTNDARGISIEDLRAEVPSLRLEGRATVLEDLKATAIDLQIVLDRWTASTYAAYLPEALTTLPAVSGEISARGPLSALGTAWTLNVADGGTAGELTVDAASAKPAAAGRVAFRNLNPAIVTGRREWDGTITVDITLDVALDVDDPLRSDASFSVAGGPIAYQGYRADSLRAQGTLANGVLTASGAASAYGARATTRVRVSRLDAPSPVISASGRIDSFDVSRLPASLQAPELTTAIAGVYAVDLTGERWSVSFDADASPIEGATLAAGSRVRADGQGNAINASLSAAFSDLPASLVMEEAPDRSTVVGGRIDAEIAIADISAPSMLDTMEATVVASLEDSQVFGEASVATDVDVTLSNGWLAVRQFDARMPAAAITATGGVAIGSQAASSSALTYELDVPDLSALPEHWVTGLRGGATVAGVIGGTADAPTTEGTFNLREPGYEDTASALTVSGSFDVAMPERDLERLVADARVEATFVTVGEQELQAAAVTARYEAQRLDLTARVDQEARSVEVDGSLALFPDYREVQLRQLTLAGLGDPWNLDRAAAGRDATIRYGEDDVRVEGLAFVRGVERVAVEGIFALPDRPATSDLRVELSGVSVGDLLTLATGEPTVTGTASGQLQLTGTLDRPEVAASIAVVDGEAGGVPFTRAQADVSLADRRAQITGRVEEPNGNAVSIEGIVPVGAEEDAPLDVRAVSTDVSLGLLAAVTTHLGEIEGTAGFDLHVGGTMAEPALTGTAYVRDAAFTIVPTGVHYERVFLDTRLDGGTISIDQASLSDRDGNTLTATGSGAVFTSDGERTVDVQIRSNGIRVLDNELGDVALTIDARARGQVLAPSISGRIEVDRGRIEVDQLLPLLGQAPAAAPPAGTLPAATPAATSAKTTSTPTSAPAPRSTPTDAPATDAAEAVEVAEASSAEMDIEVVMPDNVVLRGRNIRASTGSLGLGNMNLTIGGAFAVRKAREEPMRLVGAVEVVRGYYEFQGRRFDVERGSDIRFRGAYPIDPELNVTAQRDVSGITARVRITGTAERPRIALSSDPPLDEGEVLALIVFNQPMNQLGQSEQVDLMTRAGDIALGALATSLADSIGRALDVDLFEIRAPSAAGSGEVSLGTQVSDRLFVGFRQEIGAASASRVWFEYRLTELLRLLTSVGHGTEGGRTIRDREAAGVDLVFRIRY